MAQGPHGRFFRQCGPGHQFQLGADNLIDVLELQLVAILTLDHHILQVEDFHVLRDDALAHALSPARVSSVTIVDEETRSARVVVPDYQLSLAIGREGQNARLAARLTGWRIDIRSDAAPVGAQPDSPVR